VTGRDLKLNYGRMAREAKDLHTAGYSADDVLLAFGDAGPWYQRDWRGQRGERPSLGVIRDQIKDLLSPIAPPAWPGHPKPPNGRDRSPDALDQEIERRRKRIAAEKAAKGIA
ncbi:MAG TPA: hypothetical protein VLH56_05160, partial [Dissulfurispiraceae bacterium]|nr:hypothetical protein [Dissulfurispiraceae bacterium]